MADNSVGQIALDLTVNRNGFDRSMNNIAGIAKKAGVALAAAFSVKKLVDFGKSCLELGSDLQEVQNVVDVTFPSMTKQIDKFAKSAASQFGLSETMAKKFSGTFGSMAEAFGFSEKEAYKMSTALTGLAGDVASFYNISQDEAYTKLKSVFSGETETLKDLGVVMTQSALDSYALANGYGKVTAEMSEAEKVSLRFAFVQSQLSNAAGDFARTSNSWANQTRILSLQFDSLKASIGQGLINAFTPVIKVINTVLAKLQTLANAFKKLTENIFGNAGSSSSTEEAATATSNAMDTASGASGTVAKNTKKAAKEAEKMQKAVMGFDKLNKLSDTDASDTGSDSSGGGAGGSGDIGIKADVDTKGVNKALEKLETLKKAFLALKKQFIKGFKIGLGDTSVLDSIKGNLESIKKSILEIASNKEVQASLGNLFLTLAESAGKVAGSLSSIAFTITDNLTGGLAKYLEQNKDRIKEYLVSMFDCGAEIAQLVGDFHVAIADIFTVFRSGDAKQITADLIKIFSDAFMGVTKIAIKFGRDLIKQVTQPITKNSGKIKMALSKTLKPVKNIIGTIATTVEKTMDKINQVYDKKISPAFQDITDGITKIVGTILDNYNQYVSPVLDSLTKKFGEMWDSCIQPVLNKVADLIGNIVSCVGAFWNNILAPFIQWLIDTLSPVVMPIIELIGTVAIDILGSIGKAIGVLLDVLNGMIEFVTGIFKTNWAKAWNGVKTTFNGFNTFVSGIFKKDFSENFGALGEIMNGFMKNVQNIWNSIKTIFKGITTFISGVFTGDWKKAWTGVKDIFKGIFDGLVAIAKAPLNLIIGLINTMISGIFKGVNWLIEKVNKFSVDVPDWVPEIGGEKFGFNIKQIDTGSVKIPYLANGGYVEANTPQLAMIGDNRHQGEVVAPEDKLQSMVDSAVSQNTEAILSALRDIFQGDNNGKDIELTVNIGNKKLMREVLRTANNGNKRIGKTVYNV